MALPTRKAFFAKPFETVDPATLAEDHRDCSICHSTYLEGTEQTAPEPAVRLPCSHIFGESCIKAWLDTVRSGFYNNTCPYRCELYQPTREPNQSTHEPNQQPRQVLGTNGAAPIVPRRRSETVWANFPVELAGMHPDEVATLGQWRFDDI